MISSRYASARTYLICEAAKLLSCFPLEIAMYVGL